MMKHTTISITLILAAIISMVSCTSNNGNIGPWFGTWHIEAIERDGQAMESYDGTLFFQFQSSVVQIRYSNILHDEAQTTGRWEEADGKITLSFPDEHQVWKLLPGLDMTPHAVNRLAVERQDGNNALLSIVAADGHTYRYTLKKWGKGM